MYDVVIVGSGPAGVSTAISLISENKDLKKILLLDVGYQAKDITLPNKNLYELKSSGKYFDEIIGNNFESIEHFDLGYLSPKLKGPLMRFILESPEILKNIDKYNNFDASISYAKGGLANAWGAGVMRYNNQDLKSFPVTEQELGPYYDFLTNLIGISGKDDDLSDFFGSTDNLLPELKLSPLCERFYNSYQKRNNSYNKKGIFLGRPRLAVLTRPHLSRPEYKYNCQDFFQPNNKSIFNPAYILDDLIKDKKIEYLPNHLAESFSDISSGVELIAKDLKTGENKRISSKYLVLAAGTINTTRIVLSSYNDTDTKLPILDNPISFIPFVDLGLIGTKFKTDVFPGAELCMIKLMIKSRSYSSFNLRTNWTTKN